MYFYFVNSDVQVLHFFILRISIDLTLCPHPDGWKFIINHYQEMGVGRVPFPLGSRGGGSGRAHDTVDNSQPFCPNDASGMLVVKILIAMVMVLEPSSVHLDGNPSMVWDCEKFSIVILRGMCNLIWVFPILKFLLMLTQCTKSLELAMQGWGKPLSGRSDLVPQPLLKHIAVWCSMTTFPKDLRLEFLTWN